MLARYTMHRGKAPDVKGVRMDTRKHTRHCLRPTQEMVERFLSDDPNYTFQDFRRDYVELLRKRFAKDRTPFDELAELARHENVYLGCSCPTKKNPNVMHCHTVLALKFMRSKYRKLKVVLPKESR